MLSKHGTKMNFVGSLYYQFQNTTFGLWTLSCHHYRVITIDIIVESIKTEFGTEESTYVQLFFLGLVYSSEVLALTTACKMDLHRFPFEIQNCNITLQPAVHSDGVRDMQSPPDPVRDQNEEQFCTVNLLKQILMECRAATRQNQRDKTSLCKRVARIIDVTFLVLYIITIIVFLSMLGTHWFPQ